MKTYIVKLRSGQPDELIVADAVEEVSKNGVDWLVFKAAGGGVVAKFAEDAVASWRVQ
jgi:hypothetical protein